MRSSGLILFATVLLCIQLGSVLSKSIEGTWTNPSKSPSAATSTSDRCCIPTSIKIESESMRLMARYEYSSSNQQCNQLFNNPDPKKKYLVVDSKYGAVDAYKASAPGVDFGLLVMLDEMFTYTVTEAGLVVQSSGKNYSPCGFVMQTFEKSISYGSIFFCLIIIGAVAYGIWKKQQQNKLNKLAQEKANLNDSVDPVAAGYTAPNMYIPQQGYYQQPMPQANVQFQGQVYAQQPMVMPQANVQFQAQGHPQQPVVMPQANVQFQAQGHPQQPVAMPQAQVTLDVNAGPRPA